MKHAVILLAALVLVLGANLATGVPYPPAEVENPYINSSGVSSGDISMNGNDIDLVGGRTFMDGTSTNDMYIFGPTSGTQVAFYKCTNADCSTASPVVTISGTNYIDIRNRIVNLGTGIIDLDDEVTVDGISADGSGKAVCIKADGNLGTCADAVGVGGTCTCG